jgi:hypothetical protein
MQTSFIGALQAVSVYQMPKSCAVLLRNVAMLLCFWFSSGMSKTEQTCCFRRCNHVGACEYVSVPECNTEEELS